MSKNYHSEVVEAAYEIFALQNSDQCKGIIQNKYPHFPNHTKELFYHFAEKLKHWVVYQSIEQDRKETQIRSYTHQLDEIVQNLCRMQKALRPTLLRYDTSRQTARSLIQASNRKIEKLETEIERCEDPKKLKKLKKLKSELKDEITIRNSEIKKTEEEKRNLERRCNQLVQEEQRLKEHIELEISLRQRCIEHAKNNNVLPNIALQIYSFSIESQFFTYLSNKEYETLLQDAELGIQTKLKDFYLWNDHYQVYELKRDLHYYSILLETNLIGHKESQSSLSYLDRHLKTAFNKRLQHLDFRDYRKDAQQFYGLVCEQALEDGVMTKEEVVQMQALSSALKLSKLDAIEILDSIAIETQKAFIKKHLKVLFDLAISDSELHRAEQALILELKRKLFSSIKTNISDMMNDPIDIHLVMNDEEIFIHLCKLAKADDKFLDIEKLFIAEFAKLKGWSLDKVQHMTVKSNYNSTLEKDLEDDLWKIYQVKTPFDKVR